MPDSSIPAARMGIGSSRSTGITAYPAPKAGIGVDAMCRDATKRLFDVTSLRGAFHVARLRLAERDGT